MMKFRLILVELYKRGQNFCDDIRPHIRSVSGKESLCANLLIVVYVIVVNPQRACAIAS